MRAVAALLVLFAALAAPASAAAPSRVLVEATEYRFTLSRTTVKPGTAIVQLAIRGEDPHDLRLAPTGKARSSARPAAVPETLPGGVAEWRGKLTRGKWTLYCSLPGHKAAGMRATLTVK
jgi:plastocyanin